MKKTKQKSKEKSLEILVVEDNKEYATDAREYFSPLEKKGVVSVDYASTLAEAEKQYGLIKPLRRYTKD